MTSNTQFYPEQRLAAAVIDRALKDARSASPPLRDEARRFVTTPSPLLEFWAVHLGTDASNVIRLAQRAIRP